MSSTERLQRYLADERGGCGDDEVFQRLAELEEVDAAAGGPALGKNVGSLSALANETRYEIVRVLHIAGEELRVREFTPLLDVSDGATSHALSQFTDAGLLTRRKDGRGRN